MMLLPNVQLYYKICRLNAEAAQIFSLASEEVNSVTLRNDLIEKSIQHLQFIEDLKVAAPLGTNTYLIFIKHKKKVGKITAYMNRMLGLRLDRATENAALNASHMILSEYERASVTLSANGKFSEFILKQEEILRNQISTLVERDMMFV